MDGSGSLRDNNETAASKNGLISLVMTDRSMFKNRLSDQVYNYVVAQIFENKLVQGQKITESELAKELQISTAPVREAMIRLDQEGWIDRFPNRGAYISNHHDADNHRQLYSLRLCLEIGAFAHLAQTATAEQLGQLERIVDELEQGIEHMQVAQYRQADTGFHLAIAEFAGGVRLREMLKPVLMQIFVIVFSRDFTPKDENPAASHRALYDAIASGDPEKASNLISEHIYSQAKAHDIEI